MADLKLNPPKSKKDLNKDNMMDYVRDCGTAEDKRWYALLLKNNPKKIKNALKDNEVVDSHDWKVIREEFAKRFFFEISNKGKAEAKKAQKKAEAKKAMEAKAKAKATKKAEKNQ